jgi:short-subunit dehydrogenase involved in D-alanine esterification of teichoic acids
MAGTERTKVTLTGKKILITGGSSGTGLEAEDP